MLWGAPIFISALKWHQPQRALPPDPCKGALPPWPPPGGTAPWTSQVLLIYPGAAPGWKVLPCSKIIIAPHFHYEHSPCWRYPLQVQHQFSCMQMTFKFYWNLFLTYTSTIYQTAAHCWYKLAACISDVKNLMFTDKLTLNHDKTEFSNASSHHKRYLHNNSSIGRLHGRLLV